MKTERHVIIAVYVAALSLVVSAISTSLAAYQTFLTQESIELARVSNVQQRQIASCEEIVRLNPTSKLRAMTDYGTRLIDPEFAPIVSMASAIMSSFVEPELLPSGYYDVFPNEEEFEGLPPHLDALRGVVDEQFSNQLFNVRMGVEAYLVVKKQLQLARGELEVTAPKTKFIEVWPASDLALFYNKELPTLTLADAKNQLSQINGRLSAEVDKIAQKCLGIMLGLDRP